MQTLHLIKTIESTNLEELDEFMGQKVEITVEPVQEEETETETEKNLEAILKIVDECAGTIEPWTREELYDRKIFH